MAPVIAPGGSVEFAKPAVAARSKICLMELPAVTFRTPLEGEHDRIARAAWEGSVYAEIFSPEERAALYADPEMTRATWLDDALQLPFTWIVAVSDGSPVGTGILYALRDDSRHGLVESLFVLPSYQRRGVGTKIWNYLRGIARENGLPSLKLYVLEKNKPAIAFYEQLGCRDFGGRSQLWLGKHAEEAIGLRWGSNASFER